MELLAGLAEIGPALYVLIGSTASRVVAFRKDINWRLAGGFLIGSVIAALLPLCLTVCSIRRNTKCCFASGGLVYLWGDTRRWL